MNKKTLERIVSTAVKAPSGDNSQPWSFSYDGVRLSIYAHFDADHKILNVHNGGTYIAIGAVIENLVHAASTYNYDTKITLFPDNMKSSHIADVTFSYREESARTNITEQTIISRCTNRKPFKTTTIDSSTLQSITPDETGETNTKFITDKSLIKMYAEIAATMEKVALTTKPLHEKFFASIFWDKSANEAGKAGLYIDTLELPPPAKFLFKLLRYWKIITVLNIVNFYQLVARTNSKVYASSGAIGLIYTKNTNTPKEYISVGRTFQQTWLRCTQNKLSFQPIAGTLYLLRYLELYPDDQLINDANKSLLNRKKAELLKQSPNRTLPAMMFRIGYAEQPTATSKRRSISITYT